MVKHVFLGQIVPEICLEGGKIRFYMLSSSRIVLYLSLELFDVEKHALPF